MSNLHQGHQRHAAGGAIACPTSDELLAFASGDASDEILASIADHVASCASCDKALRTLGNHADPLSTWMRRALQLAAEGEEEECFRMMQAALALGTRSGSPAAPDPQAATAPIGVAPSSRADASQPEPLQTAAWSPAAAPETIGRYRVESLLGEGTYGRVYLAYDPQLDRQVALKVAKLIDFADDERFSAFLAEARSAARLRHPGIVTIYEVDHDEEDCHYIAMEYVQGKSLRELMVGRPQPADQVASVIRQSADAIHYAHKLGLVHRDLKPANMLLDADGRVKIADFGLALREDQQRSRAGDKAGTLAYMSPEQARGEAHRLDGRSDIWSLGVIMYELLAGRRPFQGSHHELADEILNRSPKPLRQIRDEIDPGLERICLKCLAKEPEERHSSAKDLAEALANWQQEANQPPPKPRGARRFAKRPMIALTLKIVVYAGCLLLLLSLPAAWYVNSLILSHHPGNRENRSPVWPYPVDKNATPFQWLPLLDQQPEGLFPLSNPTERWFYDERRKTILMDSPTHTVVGLGETGQDRYTIQVAITKNALVGNAGFFLGYQSLPPKDGKRRWKCQTVCVRCREGPDFFVVRSAMEIIENRAGSFTPQTEALATAPVRAEALDRAILEVTVNHNRVDQVRWQGVALAGLADRPNGQQIDGGREAPECLGRFGLMNSGGSTTFSDAKFMFMSQRSTHP